MTDDLRLWQPRIRREPDPRQPCADGHQISLWGITAGVGMQANCMLSVAKMIWVSVAMRPY
jgi:hypothetical protein